MTKNTAEWVAKLADGSEVKITNNGYHYRAHNKKAEQVGEAFIRLEDLVASLGAVIIMAQGSGIEAVPSWKEVEAGGAELHKDAAAAGEAEAGGAEVHPDSPEPTVAEQDAILAEQDKADLAKLEADIAAEDKAKGEKSDNTPPHKDQEEKKSAGGRDKSVRSDRQSRH